MRQLVAVELDEDDVDGCTNSEGCNKQGDLEIPEPKIPESGLPPGHEGRLGARGRMTPPIPVVFLFKGKMSEDKRGRVVRR